MEPNHRICVCIWGGERQNRMSATTGRAVRQRSPGYVGSIGRGAHEISFLALRLSQKPLFSPAVTQGRDSPRPRRLGAKINVRIYILLGLRHVESYSQFNAPVKQVQKITFLLRCVWPARSFAITFTVSRHHGVLSLRSSDLRRASDGFSCRMMEFGS